MQPTYSIGVKKQSLRVIWRVIHQKEKSVGEGSSYHPRLRSTILKVRQKELLTETYYCKLFLKLYSSNEAEETSMMCILRAPEIWMQLLTLTQAFCRLAKNSKKEDSKLWRKTLDLSSKLKSNLAQNKFSKVYCWKL